MLTTTTSNHKHLHTEIATPTHSARPACCLQYSGYIIVQLERYLMVGLTRMLLRT